MADGTHGGGSQALQMQVVKLNKLIIIHLASDVVYMSGLSNP